MILIFIVHCSISAVERLNMSDSILETSVQPSEQNEHLNMSDSILETAVQPSEQNEQFNMSDSIPHEIDAHASNNEISPDSSEAILDIDWNNLRYIEAVGKRRDCKKMIFTRDEKNLYGKNRELASGETAYLCREYYSEHCKSRLYMKDGRLYKKPDFVPHNHPSREEKYKKFEIECKIKEECGNLEVLVNARTQSSAVSEIFDKHMKM